MNGRHGPAGEDQEAKKQIRERLRKEIEQCRAALLEADKKLMELRQSEPAERSTGSREGKRPHKANTHYTFQPGEEAGQRSGKKKSGQKESSGTKRKTPSRAWDNPREQKRIKFAQERDRRMHNMWNSCLSILKMLTKHRYGWPFLTPVDAVKLNIPDYYDIIQNPMDFGTIEKRIQDGYYDSPLKFRDDVRLVFSNCRIYNKPGQDVRFMGDSLEAVFEKRWDNSRIESKLEEEKSRLAAEEEEIANTPIMSDSIPDAQALQSQLANLSRELEEIKGGKKGQVKSPDMDFRPTRAMTFDEKRTLSVNLGNLPGEKLSRVVEIIQQGTGDINQGEDEIELDIDALDNDTLWRLDRYVKSCLKIKSGKRSRYSDGEKMGRVQSNLEGTVNELAQVESKLDGRREDEVDIGGVAATEGGDVEIEQDKNMDSSSSSSDSEFSSDLEDGGSKKPEPAGEEGGDSKDSKEAGLNKPAAFDVNEASTSFPLTTNKADTPKYGSPQGGAEQTNHGGSGEVAGAQGTPAALPLQEEHEVHATNPTTPSVPMEKQQDLPATDAGENNNTSPRADNADIAGRTSTPVTDDNVQPSQPCTMKEPPHQEQQAAANGDALANAT
eukprot:scaffold1518_cov331-Pavlova_lutheri.AAC.7